jgi:hypothetical protein
MALDSETARDVAAPQSRSAAPLDWRVDLHFMDPSDLPRNMHYVPYRLARDPRGYGGRDRAGSIDLAISQTMVCWMGRVLFYSFPYGPASSFSPFLKSMFREKE